MNSSSDHSGMLIVRLWLETDHPQGLRARITQSTHGSAAEEAVAVAADADDICAIVRQWVEDFAAPGPRSGNGRA